VVIEISSEAEGIIENDSASLIVFLDANNLIAGDVDWL
jgi:hypothetical protein